MIGEFGRKLIVLKKAAHEFNEENNTIKNSLLQDISKLKIPENKSLLTYYDILLFLCAHPVNIKTVFLVERELKRISTLLAHSIKLQEQYINTGLPYVKTITGYSHDLLRWLIEQKYCTIKIDHYKNSILTVREAIRFTLPSLEREETSANYTNEEMFDALKVKERERLNFLLWEFSKLDHVPLIKDQLFDGMGIYVKISPKEKSFSKAYNRFLISPVYYQQELLRKFDHAELLNKVIPKTTLLTDIEKRDLIITIKNSLTIGARETDTATYMDTASLRYYVLERGIAIAIYGMMPERQLPLESYVGYTLFKNGFPAAYGGGWVFGKRSLFGININESFRGGESGYMMCQLLRLYKHVFSIDYFEVEPYQYGYENPEGIESGAFWFYYRYGFRPLDKNLRALAEKEHKLIATNKNFRTSAKTLIKFTESNVALNLGKGIPPMVSDITSKVSKLIQNNYGSNRIKAENELVKLFLSKSTSLKIENENEEQVLKEVAFLAEVLKVNEPDKIALLAKMVKIKPVDQYRYQNLLLQFFQE